MGASGREPPPRVRPRASRALSDGAKGRLRGSMASLHEARLDLWRVGADAQRRDRGFAPKLRIF